MVNVALQSPLEGITYNPSRLDSWRGAAGTYNVLFVCRDNSVCSIIAEAILTRWGGDDFRAYSAGIRPAGEVHPVATELLQAQRLWDEERRPQGCAEFLRGGAPRMDYVISVGEQRPDDLPVAWPGNPSIMHWRISEPGAAGDPEQQARTFRKTFWELENRIKLFALICERELGKQAA